MTVDMRSFLQEIKKTNDVFTVKKRVSTKYEIAAVTEKLDGSKAALFENVKGSKFKLISNLVGSRDRFAQAIGSKKSDINQKIVKAISLASLMFPRGVMLERLELSESMVLMLWKGISLALRPPTTLVDFLM